MDKYDHKKIESKWQAVWKADLVYSTPENNGKPKKYVLDMFPYPSGEGLHVGHPKGYIATDVYSRMKRMQGFNVLHPMGWDAFGLPAEQYAIKNKVHPRVAVEKNVARYKEQLSSIGFDYDWTREVNTTDPAFYKWSQWIFLKMFEKGLAYESYEPINWCPTCQTGLANEDLEDGKCERCDTRVEKKPMRQWVLRITQYADRMLADLDKLDWPVSIKESQKNWIGKSEGAEIKFKVKSQKSKVEDITVFTTRPDTLFGATYCVLAPENKIIDEIKDSITNWDEVKKYREEVKNKTEIERTAEGKEKTGIELEGIKVVNPANNEEIPLYTADYVLGHYGTGAVMAVPAHDERDFKFAKKFRLSVKQVVLPVRVDTKNPHQEGYPVVERKMVHALIRNKKTGEYLMLDWKNNPWTTFVLGGVEDNEDEFEAITREIKEEAGLSNLKFIFKSITAYSEYGAPHKQQNRVAHATAYFFEYDDNSIHGELSEEEKEKHEPRWVNLDKELPNNFTCSEWDIWASAMRFGGVAPMTELGRLTNSNQFNGLSSEEAKKKITDFVGGRWVTKYRLKDWVFSRQRYWGEPFPLIHCEKCGVVPVPEKDLPVLLPEVESYAPTGTGESPLADISEWVNVACPKCGGEGKRETNTMPQWAGSSWYYLRFIDSKNEHALVDKEKEKYWSPVDMYVGGAEHATRHLIYARFYHKFLFDIGVVNYDEPFLRLQNVGLIMAEDGRKMSKRWGNVVNPDDIVATYGADTLRLYEMFMGPFGQSVAWSTESIIGPRRFLERVWRLRERISVSATGVVVETTLHKTIKKVSEDIESFNFNTAVASLMSLVNEMEKVENISTTQYEILLKLLAPFTPHITEELWTSFGQASSIHLESWPLFDPSKCVENEVTIAIQVMGKLRDTMIIPRETDEKAIEDLALQRQDIQKWISGKSIKKIIIVKGRLVNIVIDD